MDIGLVWLHGFLKRFSRIVAARSHASLARLATVAVGINGERIMNLIRIAGLVLVGFAVLIEPALAGGPVAAPGPVAGIGLPALVLIGGAYWIGRQVFGRRQ